MSKTHDYGEPWTYNESEEPALVTVDNEPVLTGASYQLDADKMQRAVLCVNECAGIDPAAALTAAREALEAEELWRNQRDDTGTLRAIAKEKRLKAINLLTPAP